MRTPAGKECSYFYGNYFRGRNDEECRLIKDKLPGEAWHPKMCDGCPVPAIQQANSCEHQRLAPRIERAFFVGKPKVEVSTYCEKCVCAVDDPHIGCGQCHNLPFFTLGD